MVTLLTYQMTLLRVTIQSTAQQQQQQQVARQEEIALLHQSVQSTAQQQQQQQVARQEEIALLHKSVKRQQQQQQQQQQQVSAPELPHRSTPIHKNYHQYSATIHGVTFQYLTTNPGHHHTIVDHLEREKDGYGILHGAVTEHNDPFSPALVMDIGSNHGMYALFAATLGADVIALEPQQKYFDVIRAAARVNGLEVERHIQVYHYGALDAREMVTMADHEINEGGIGHLVVGGKTDINNNPSAVETHFIDDFLPHDPRRAVDLLKVDVEGFEIQALRSANKLLEESKGRVRNVLVEFGPPSRWERSGTSAADGVQLLRTMRDHYGFEPRVTDSFALEPFRQRLVRAGGRGEKKSAYGATYLTVSGDSEIDLLVEAMRQCNCESYVWFASTVVFDPDDKST